MEPAQQARWNRLVKERHYLRSANLVGEQCRYAVSYQGQWVALLGWSAAAWHLGPRDEWLGWSEEQRRRRLHFLAQNSRFVILADRTRHPNLGTRSMKLCLDRLSADWQAQHGHPLVALESFVDGQLFRGTLYKASNWTRLGPTAGFCRVAEDFYVRHARPKQLWVWPLQPPARAWRGAPQLPAPLRAYEKALSARCDLTPGRLASLRERFTQVSEFRKGQGKRHRIATVLAIAAGAKRAGVIGGYSGVASYARNLTRPQRRALHCWFNPKTNEYEVPSESCFLRMLQGVSPLEVESLMAWQDQVLGPNPDPLVAIDGKTLKHSGVHLAGAIRLPSHRCLGVEPVADKSNEIPATQRLIARAPILPGQMVSLDAMHTQHRTVAQILFDKGADYLLPIKGNQDTLLQTAPQLLPEGPPPQVVRIEDNRSRRERRALATRAIEPAQLGLAGAAQLGCRHRQSGKDAKPEVEYLVTSRAAGKLSPEEFLNTDRQYWGVESGLHQRLDCSGFEDRLRVRHKGAVHILGLFARVGVALFVRWAKNQRRVRDRTFPNWREWNSGHRWHVIRQVVDSTQAEPQPWRHFLTATFCAADGHRFDLPERFTPFCSLLTHSLALTQSPPQPAGLGL